MSARVVAVRIVRVTAPFVRAVATAHGSFSTRSGVFVALDDSAGRTGWGEASPWPPFGDGDGDDAERVARTLSATCTGRAVEDVARVAAAQSRGPGVAAVAAAFEQAASDLLAAAAGLPLARWLRPDARPAVPLNAIVDLVTPDVAARTAARARADGYGTLKIKVGSPDVNEDVARVGAVRAAAGAAMRIRLDANGAWSGAAAVRACSTLAAFDLEYVEQPCPAGDLAGNARVRAESGVPVALDESIRDVDSARAALDAGAADALVVKPALAGGFAALRAIAALAGSRGVDVVVTTAFDFGIGIAGALHAAAAFASPGRACGLATAALLADDLTDGAPPVRDGAMALPPGAGLGVVPARALGPA